MSFLAKVVFGLMGRGWLPKPLTLDALFSCPIAIDEEQLRKSVHGYHPSLNQAEVNLFSDSTGQKTSTGTVRWAHHSVLIMSFDQPVAEECLDLCEHKLHAAPTGARSHIAHAQLTYTGAEADIVERYVALALVAGALVPFGTTTLLNQNARSCIDASEIDQRQLSEDIIEKMQTSTPLWLWCGLGKFKAEGNPCILLRTFGNNILGFSELAYWVKAEESEAELVEMFADVLRYLRDNRLNPRPGFYIQMGENVLLELRTPKPAEFANERVKKLLVIERTTRSAQVG